MPFDNIWDHAIEVSKKTEKENRQTKDSTVLLVGSKGGGKTSISYRFVERTENPKPTLALEYLFGRRNRGLDMDKEICHIWELGGGTLFTQLLEIPITSASLLSLSAVLVLDLSVPEELWFTMETLLQTLRSLVDNKLNSVKDSALKDALKELAWKRIGSDHEDKEMIDPFPIPLLILGSKYDIFQDFDPEKKKVICRCLRFVAHVNAAALQFISSKSESLVNKGRVAISHLVFGSQTNKTPLLDYNKPIYIPFGGDSLKSIGNMPLADDDSGRIHSRSLDMWKDTFISHFPQVVSKNTIPEDPGKDPHFKERDIDIMRAQKDKELEEYKRHLQQKKPDWDSINMN